MIGNDKTIKLSTAAIITYIGISSSANVLISVTTPDIPLIKHCFLLNFLNSDIASMVESDEVVSSNNTINKVAFP